MKRASNSKRTSIFIVVEVQSQDDYFAHQPLKIPIAAFICKANALEFVERKKRCEFLNVDWEVIPVPVEDLNATNTKI